VESKRFALVPASLKYKRAVSFSGHAEKLTAFVFDSAMPDERVIDGSTQWHLTG
jgi:hypothetical protein